jgi:hypothetical protein
MVKKSSPKSQQRLRVMDAYRGRGRRNSNLWLGYSEKLGQDCIVTNDRQLVHWIVFLEIDPTVKCFDLASQATAGEGDANVNDVIVTRIDNSQEIHRVICDHSLADGSEQEAPQSSDICKVRFFRDPDLTPHVRLAVRWKKALAYAAAIRGQKHTPVVVALHPVLKARMEGDIRQVIDDLSGFDEPTVIGILVRLAIAGNISLELTNSGLCNKTGWKWNDEVQNVDA